MNYAIFGHLSSQIQSLTDSTDLTVENHRLNVKVALGRRCSDYRSHQTVEFSPAYDSTFGAATVKNGRYTVVLGAYDAPENMSFAGWDGERPLPVVQNGFVCDEYREHIPAALLAGLADDLALVGYKSLAGYEVTGLVRVLFFVPRLTGWNEDGTPIFERGVAAPIETEWGIVY